MRRDCYDFEATIAHEVGHVLGFHHPDQFPDANLRAARDADGVAPLPMDNASCWAPLQQIELGALPSGADTIMHSTTKHRDRTCLTADDLEGLNYLYPICDGAATEPNCVKTRRLGGWLRLAAAVATPYVVVSVALMMLQCIARGYQWRKVHELEETTHRLRKEARRMKGKLARMPTRHGSPDGRRGDGSGRSSLARLRQWGTGKFSPRMSSGAPPEYTGHSSNIGEAPTRPLTRGSLEQLEQQQMAYALEASRAEEAERAAAERSAGGGGGGGGGFNPDNRSSVSAASDRPSVTLEMPPSTMSPVGRGSVVATEQAMSQDV